MLNNEIEKHLKAVKSFDEDSRDLMRKTLASANIRSWVFGGFALFAVVALIMVVWRFKQPEVVVYRVDNATGKVERVYSAVGIQQTYSEAVDKYWLAKYIEYRESYSMAFGKEYYDYVGYMSESEEQARYSRYMSKDNPVSPINIFKDVGFVRVHITSFSKVNDQTYIVDFIKESGLPGKPSENARLKATIVWHYTGTPADEDAQQANPLGLKVSEYRISQDSYGASQ